jgi:hypothetical protein
MQILVASKTKNARFAHQIRAREFNSTLEIPKGDNPLQNAWLTITINYELNFVDRRNPNFRTTIRNGQAFIKDLNGIEFPLRDWDVRSQSEFVKRFNKGEAFWNYKFLLITPTNYNGFDYQSFGKGLVCRPNVICLFRLKSGGSPNHLKVDVVRAEEPESFWDRLLGKSFRSDAGQYTEGDVKTNTLWHELGHALDQLHIRALQGDAQCMVDINADRCYDGDNIMGRGSELSPLNAKPWRELIAHHTDIPAPKWIPTMAVNTPPRSIPMGVAVVAMPSRF